MIRIYTTPAGVRHYEVTAALRDVACEVFPGFDDTGAVFMPARTLLADHLATCESIAITVGHEPAVAFARDNLQVRKTGMYKTNDDRQCGFSSG